MLSPLFPSPPQAGRLSQLGRAAHSLLHIPRMRFYNNFLNRREWEKRLGQKRINTAPSLPVPVHLGQQIRCDIRGFIVPNDGFGSHVVYNSVPIIDCIVFD